MAPVLRVRMTGEPSLRLSDFVHDEVTQQCSNPDECGRAASDEVQLSSEVSGCRGQEGRGGYAGLQSCTVCCFGNSAD